MTTAMNQGLGRAELWPPALAAFLLRGGIVVYVVPVLVLPSTVGLATFVGPTAVTPAGPSPEFVRLIVALAAALVAWYLVGGLVAGAAEAALLRSQSDLAPGLGRDRRPSPGLAGRVVLIRFAFTLPLLLVTAIGLPIVVSAAYGELTSPLDVATPLLLRVLGDVPEVLAAMTLAWLFAETASGLAVRHLVLGRRGVPEAMLAALGHLVRRPVASLATQALVLAGSVFLMAPGLIVAAFAWDRTGWALADPAAPPIALAILTLLFVTAWLGGVGMAGAAAAWRSVAWTLEAARGRDG